MHFYQPLSWIALTLSLAPAAVAQDYTSRDLYNFPPPRSWLENLAVRSNGSVLATMLSPNASLWEMNPPASGSTTGTTNLVHYFDGSAGVLGITETTTDVFYVATTNKSITSTSSAPALNRFYRVAFPGPDVSLLASVTGRFINGLTTLNSTTILAADSFGGAVLAINTNTGSITQVIQDPLMQPLANPQAPLGINGLKIRNNTLYFSNNSRFLFAKIAIHANGTAAGPVVNITSSASLPPANQARYDDFCIDSAGTYAYVATGAGNVVQRIDLSSGATEVFGGNVNSTTFAEPTSVAFGRGSSYSNILFVTTAGATETTVYYNGTHTPAGGIGGQLGGLFPPSYASSLALEEL